MTDGEFWPLKSCWELVDIPFPQCHEFCAIAKYLGVGECESISVCAVKFKKEIMQSSETGGQNE